MIKAAFFIAILLAGIEIQAIQKQTDAHNPQHGHPTDEQKQEPAGSPGGNSQSSGRQKTTGNQSVPDQKAWDWHEAFAPPTWPNWALVIIGLFAVAATVCTLRVILRQTQATEKTLVLTQRPRITVRNLYFSEIKPTGGVYQFPNGIQDGSFCSGQFYLVNSGGTRARLREILCQVFEAKFLPMKRPYEGRIGDQGEKILQPGQSLTYLFGRGTSLDKTTAYKISEGSIGLYVLGWIGYVDDLDIYRITSFCREYNVERERFVPVDNPDYENSD